MGASLRVLFEHNTSRRTGTTCCTEYLINIACAQTEHLTNYCYRENFLDNTEAGFLRKTERVFEDKCSGENSSWDVMFRANRRNHTLVFYLLVLLRWKATLVMVWRTARFPVSLLPPPFFSTKTAAVDVILSLSTRI